MLRSLNSCAETLSSGNNIAGTQHPFTVVSRTRGNSKSRASTLRWVRSYPQVELFVTRLHPETGVDDVCEYVQHKSGVDIPCEQLSFKYGDYASFWLSVTGRIANDLLMASYWPDDVLARKFFRRKRIEKDQFRSAETEWNGGDSYSHRNVRPRWIRDTLDEY